MDLNTVWFILIVVLFIGYAVLDGFDLGIGASCISFKQENDRQILLKSIGPFWDGNEVWLVAAGGALFAAFPGAYASIFSGFYIPLILLLVGIIFRAVSIEFRNKESSTTWRQTWDIAFSASSIIILFVLGVAVGNFLLPMPIDAAGNININFFQLFTPLPVLVGLLGVFYFAMHGAIYATMKSSGELYEKTRKKAMLYAKIALPVFVIMSLLITFDVLHIAEKKATFVPINFGIKALFFAIPIMLKKNKIGLSFVLSSLITVLYISNIAINLFPNWLVATPEINNNLTIYNTASSSQTLEIMLIIACIGMPVVIGYTIAIYRIFRGKVQLEDI